MQHRTISFSSMTSNLLPVMTKDVPLMMESRTEMWMDGRDASFIQKLKPMVTIGSRSKVRGKKPANGLVALAHMASTSWML